MRILISGGSRGIGRACVERFCRDGHSVVFLYQNSHAKAEELMEKTHAVGIRCEISDSSNVSHTVASAYEILGGIDVLVNNAGISQFKLFTELTDADWGNMLNTNLSGSFYLAREVAKGMISQHHGRIVNIGSMWGKVGASCEVHYSASKAGLRGLTMALAKELGPSGITVNCIEPGVIDTDMNRSLDADTKVALCEETPLCRMGTTEEVASLVAFLASEEASFITGQCIGIDGGFAI